MSLVMRRLLLSLTLLPLAAAADRHHEAATGRYGGNGRDGRSPAALSGGVGSSHVSGYRDPAVRRDWSARWAPPYQGGRGYAGERSRRALEGRYGSYPTIPPGLSYPWYPWLSVRPPGGAPRHRLPRGRAFPFCPFEGSPRGDWR